MFKIHIASAKDIPLIRQLTLAVWPQTYAAILSPQQINYMLEMMYSESSLRQQIEEGSQFIIAYDENEPVGFAAYQEIKTKTWKLHKIYILATQQGKGTGKFLIEHIIKEVRRQGAAVLQLQVNRFNKAKSFYEKIGFKVVEEANFDIGHGYFMNDYVMEKKL